MSQSQSQKVNKSSQSTLHGFFKRPRNEPSSSFDPGITKVERVQVDRENTRGNPSQLQVYDSSIAIEPDPGLRLPLHLLASNSKELEVIRRSYILKGHCQPRLKSFPQSIIYNVPRRFNVEWYVEFDWLEYSIAKDAAYYLYCYLFKVEHGGQAGGGTFVSEGYRNWN